MGYYAAMKFEILFCCSITGTFAYVSSSTYVAMANKIKVYSVGAPKYIVIRYKFFGAPSLHQGLLLTPAVTRYYGNLEKGVFL